MLETQQISNEVSRAQRIDRNLHDEREGKDVEHQHLWQRGVWNNGGSCFWEAEVGVCQEVVQINR